MLSGHNALVLKMPRGFREQPGWIFIGTMCALVGLSYLLGISQSTITAALNPAWLKVWGAGLSLTGATIVYATGMANRPLERLSLRLLAVGLLVYMGWILAVVPSRATMTVFMCLSLIVTSQIRVAVIGILFNAERDLTTRGGG